MDWLREHLDRGTTPQTGLMDGGPRASLKAVSVAPATAPANAVSAASAKAAPRRRLGEIFVDLGLLTDDEVLSALGRQRERSMRLGDLLLDEGRIQPGDLLRALAIQFGLEFEDLADRPIDLELAQTVPPSLAKRHRAVPIRREGDAIVVAMANPIDVLALDDLKSVLGTALRPVMADPEQIMAAVDRTRSADSRVLDAIREAADELAVASPEKEDVVQDVAEESPMVRFIDLMLTKAVQERASDIHIEPFREELRIRFRVDGVLGEAMQPPRALHSGIISRIKVMADLDIAERRAPQDGRVAHRIGSEDIDIRVSTIPTVHGEACVLRVLRPDTQVASLEGADLLPSQLDHLHAALARSWGSVIVTGPTGSGKTTTLYAALRYLNKPTHNIITVEDPVEYQLTGIKQIQVNLRAQVTFARALRSILRADPDIILIGEIRDAETARIATEASLTGHLVLSTLHTNDAASAPLRLIDMGVEPYLVTSAVSLLTAQRLVRRLCTSCKRPESLAPQQTSELGIPGHFHNEKGGFDVFGPAGCERCGGSGYRGRQAIHEVLPFSDEIGELVMAHKGRAEINRSARQAGMLTLLEVGLHRVAEGTTSLAEILRLAGQ
ncbi:MAG: Flp pilus assembly complex ATPase component [Actinomycetia bacterium]|nr:Flp pilus assembly complex ATPase component [Actinomycetes bacterium]